MARAQYFQDGDSPVIKTLLIIEWPESRIVALRMANVTTRLHNRYYGSRETWNGNWAASNGRARTGLDLCILLITTLRRTVSRGDIGVVGTTPRFVGIVARGKRHDRRGHAAEEDVRDSLHDDTTLHGVFVGLAQPASFVLTDLGERSAMNRQERTRTSATFVHRACNEFFARTAFSSNQYGVNADAKKGPLPFCLSLQRAEGRVGADFCPCSTESRVRKFLPRSISIDGTE